MKIKTLSGSIVGAGGDTTLLDPTTGSRWIIVHYTLTVNVAGLIIVFDGTDSTTSRVFYGFLSPGAAGNFPEVLGSHPLTSVAVNNLLKATVPSGTTLYWQIHYYERA